MAGARASFLDQPPFPAAPFSTIRSTTTDWRSLGTIKSEGRMRLFKGTIKIAPGIEVHRGRRAYPWPVHGEGKDF